MKKTLAAIGLGLTIATAGCGGTPEATAPNGTYEQVKHDLGGGDLGDLALGQTLSFSIRSGEAVKLYNVSKQPVDEAAFKRTVGYFATKASSKLGAVEMKINPNGTSAPVSITSTNIERTATEHAFVMLPADADMPPAADQGATAITLHRTEQSQEISVVTQEAGKKFEQDKGLAVEACQSTVQTLGGAAEANGDPEAVAVNNRLVQETFCNAMGLAATEAAAGASYDDYAKANNAEQGNTLYFNGGTYDITYPTLTESQYAGMQQDLAPATAN